MAPSLQARAEPQNRAEHRRRLPPPVGDGRYEFQRLIGEGRHKRVYLAYDRHLGRDVGLALIKARAFDDLGEARVWREFEVMERLSGNANTVALYATGEDRHCLPYAVTEHLEGGDLAARITSAQREPIGLAEVLRIAADAASALAHIHSHAVIHRDIKPENLWITSTGATKLGDFGLSLTSGERQPDAGDAIEGTAAYIAPEQALGGPADSRSDLYSLGALVYELLCGRPPFVAGDPGATVMAHLYSPAQAPSTRRADVPAALDALVMSLLEKAPDHRPQTASHVIDALAGVRPISRRVALARRLSRRGRGQPLRGLAA